MFQPHCEMSYGDQAALVGILSLVQPDIAVEVGTYKGGSLELIAAAARQAHTFDLVSHVDDSLPNVEYHLGFSRVTLPAVLNRMHKEGSSVDFALIDGDHERGAVANDLRAILDSPAAQRTIILMHDAANEDVRAGIRDAGLERPHVVFADLSFTAPSERLRPWDEGWGGFALIVVDRVGDFWPHARGVAGNSQWQSSVPQRLGWHALAPLRAARRHAAYGLRPVVRKFRGTRGSPMSNRPPSARSIGIEE